jgi:molecular chaperone DnaK
MTEKANALAQVAMKLGEAIYKEEQASGAAASAGGDDTPVDDNVVDAEFSEVEDDKKD